MNPLINSLVVRAADAPAIKPAVELGTPLAGFALTFVAWTPVGGLSA